jgi:hypothetical protein
MSSYSFGAMNDFLAFVGVVGIVKGFTIGFVIVSVDRGSAT